MFGFGMGRSGVVGGMKLLSSRIASLFRSGEQGVWYDPSDRATLFQDAAGTTPVTAVGQPVGLMLDKSGRGNHAFQSTSASRPVLSARVNLLTKTEDFSDSVWVKDRATVLSNVEVAPNGSLTADKLVEDTSSNTTHVLTQKFYPSVGLCTFSICMKAAERTHATLYTWASGGNQARLTINLTNGNVVGNSGPFVNVAVVHLGSGWFNVQAQFAPDSTALREFQLRTADETGNNAYTGDGTSGIYIWGASLVPADQSSLPHQSVNTATDYDTAGFPHYLRFDSIDDFLVTNSIDFTGTDKMTVAAGVRTLASSVGVLVELSASTSSSQGTFHLATLDTGGVESAALSLTDAPNSFVGYTPSTRPVTYVASVAFDASTNTYSDQIKYRANTTPIVDTDATPATGPRNFTDAPLYIGRRGGTTLPFNGHLYSLVVRGAASTDSQIAATEKWTNQKTKAYA